MGLLSLSLSHTHMHAHTHTHTHVGMGHYLVEAFAYQSVSRVMALCVLVFGAWDVRTMYQMIQKDRKRKLYTPES